MDTRNLASLAGVLLVLGAAGWYWGMGPNRSPVVADDQRRRPDYVLHGLTGLETREDGSILRRVSASEVRHYDKPQESADIDKPVFTFYDSGQESWRLSANRGELVNNNQELVLHEQVHAERRDPAAIPVALDTEQLHVRPEDERLFTPRQVTVASPHARLSSLGLEADMRNGNLVLNQNVTGSYAPTRP